MSKKKLFTIIVSSIIAIFLINLKAPIINIKNHTQTIKKVDDKKGKTLQGFIEYRKTHEAPIFVKMREIEEKKKAEALAKEQAEKERLAAEVKAKQEAAEEKKKEAQNKWFDIKVSYYSNTVQSCSNTRAISADGTNLNKYSLNRGSSDYLIPIAAPKSIPMGTHIFVQNLGMCVVKDRGNAVVWQNGRAVIDVFIPNVTDKEMMNMGIWNTKGYIVK